MYRARSNQPGLRVSERNVSVGWHKLDPRRPGNREAVLQHLEARGQAAGDGQDDRDGGLNNFAGRLDPRGDLTDDYRPGVTRQDVPGYRT